MPDEPSAALSLAALTNWLAARLGMDRARELTEPFARVKDLRKQYPIHEHYEDAAGERVVRSEIQQAIEYFGFLPHHDHAAKWKRVVDRFMQALSDLEDAATTSS